ncbi:MAG: leucine-rich repeat protein [Bacteroidales bacterium]|nr:leucine-rich repeat protein [Bacteroidales bacterium]
MIKIGKLQYGFKGKDAIILGCEKDIKEITIPTTIKCKGEEFKVVCIAGSAFKDCYTLNSIIISNNITTIGWSAFKNCYKLASVIIPHNVTEIGNEAFSDCKNLTSITISNIITRIGDFAFSGCKNLTQIIIPNRVTEIEKQNFKERNRTTIPKNVKIVFLADEIEKNIDKENIEKEFRVKENDIENVLISSDKEFVGHINEEDKELFIKLHNERLEDIKTFNKPAYKQYWSSIIDKYPDSAHFIYELLQNADDAGATKVEMFIDKNYLIFKHNGLERFSISDETNTEDNTKKRGHINAITGIGFTTKGDLTTQNKIGKFGVGFKSVFQYTDRPEIYDDTFCFCIENYIVPTWINKEHALRKKGETLFFIPFKHPQEAYIDIKNKLKHIKNPSLFLNNIQLISWKDTNEEKTHIYKKEMLSQSIIGDIKCDFLELSNYENSKQLYLFSKQIDFKEHGSHNISVGYFLENGEINTRIRPKIHCFFPTKDTLNLPIVMHAPFLLTDSRQNIKENEEINKYLIKELSILAAEALPLLRDIGIENKKTLINENILDIVPLSETNRYHWYSNKETETILLNLDLFFNSYLDIIKSEELILGRNNEYLSVEQCRIANPINIQDFFSDEQLCLLTQDDNLSFVFPNISSKNEEKYDYLVEELDIEIISSEDIADYIKENTEFMQNQEDKWLHRFYSFLYSDAIKLWKKETATKKDALPFRFTPIIRTTEGNFIAPYDKDALNVFYQTVGVENDNLFYVDPKLLENTRTKKFFDELGIKESDRKDIITQILVRYEKGGEINNKDLVSDLCVIYEYCSSLPFNQKENEFNRIKERFAVVCLIDDKTYYGSIKDVYDTNLYPEYFKNNTDIKTFNYDFYKEVFNKYGRDNILNLLYQLGLNKKPFVKEERFNDTTKLSEKQKREVIDESKRPHNYEIIDYRMEGLEYAIKHNLTPKLSKDIWNLIEGNFKNWDLSCFYIYTNREELHEGEAEITDILKRNAWLYNSTGKKYKPKDITWEELSKVGYVYKGDLINFLGITKEGDNISSLTKEQQETYAAGIWLQQLESEGYSKRYLEDLIKKDKIKEKQKTKISTNDIFSNKESLRNVSEEEMFSDSNEKQSFSKSSHKKENTSQSYEERLNKIIEQQEVEFEQEKRLEELREIANNSTKYSKEWFEALLELEYKNSKEDSSIVNNKAISIKFQRVEKENGTNRIYTLKNPSKPIPLDIEEVGNINVKFLFADAEEKEFVFEVANVRDFTLRLKAKNVDEERLESFDWTKCVSAEININNPIELIGKLRNAFKELELPNNYNLKDNIRNDLEFIFGPPGTGKTTYLSNYIINLINSETKCKILVLTPTNKACDVLTTKIIEKSDCNSWLRRFVACGDQTIAEKGFVCDRESEIYNEEKCCVISTIARLSYDGFYCPNIELRNIDWDYIIIDEASMIPLAQIIYAIYRFDKSKIIIAGDPFQISPIVREDAWVDENIYTMINLNSFENPRTEPHDFTIKNLETQYRSLTSIGTLFSEYAYNGRLKHYRKNEKPCGLKLDNLNISTINFIPFRVEKYDSIYGGRKLGGSNVQIYSVLLTIEFVKYISQQWDKHNKESKILRIGVICPYAAQAQIINSMLQHREETYQNIEIVAGTIHGFQGDECDVIITVLNAPKGLNKSSSEKIFLNRKNILNVAISRARDYLFVLMPHADTEGYANLREIKRIGSIGTTKCKNEISVFNADMIEKALFDDPNFIEKNTFVTSHQMSNIYTDAQQLYEVRIDENSVDIQINYNDEKTIYLL